MKWADSFLQSITVSAIFLGVFVLNMRLESPILGVILLCAYVLAFGLHAGAIAAPRERPALRWWIGTWILLSCVLLIGSAAYYVAQFTAPVAQGIALLTPPALWLIGKKVGRSWLFDRAHDLMGEKIHTTPRAFWLASACTAVCLFLTAWLIFAHRTIDAVRSIWTDVPAAAFVAFFLAILLLAALLMRGHERSVTIMLTMAALLIFVNAALLALPLGFGFDTFIHQATEEHIAQFGTITPKPFYYIGQYALTLFAHHAFFIPVALTDKLLLPLATAFLLPLAWYGAAAHLTRDKTLATVSVLGIFLLPLSAFIVTTPQGLANLWTLLCILAAVPYVLTREKPRLIPLAIGALATVLIHPIAGIPITLFVLLCAVRHRTLRWALAIVGSVSLPASFLVNAIIAKTPIDFSLAGLAPTSLLRSLHLDLFFENRFDPILDFVYLYGFNALLVIAVLACMGLWFHHRHVIARPKAEAIFSRGLLRSLRSLAMTDTGLKSYLWMVLILAINYLVISSALHFTFLIDYERTNYTTRLIPLMAFFLSPFLILGVSAVAQRLKSSPLLMRAGALALVAGIITNAFYLTYPRDDGYVRDHGFNVSRDDVDAVHAIDDLMGAQSHIVLANQSVSAAAIRELGFKQYYGNLYYYPIPTGGELYQYFLKMNEAPTHDVAVAAMDFANTLCEQTACIQESVETLFFVVNDYWWDAPRIVEIAKNTADDWFSLAGPKVHIFRYDR